jgi:hypothetical protein
VIGTGVNGSGIVIRALTAVNAAKSRIAAARTSAGLELRD